VTLPVAISEIIFYAAIVVVLLLPLALLLKPRELRHPINPLLLAFYLGALAFVAWMLDARAGLSDSWLVCAGFILAGFGFSAALAVRCRSRVDWCLGLAFVAAMVALHYCDLTPVKPYRRFYDGVQTGMTQSEVVSLLHRTFPDGGRFRAPAQGVTGADCISFALENLDNHDHARLIILSLREGKVASKAYVPGAMY
jgi:hypothetical protein